MRSYVEGVERLMLGNLVLPAEIKNMTAQMLAREAEVFPNDLRFISDFQIFQNADGEFRVRAEARLAKELVNEH